jgi:hypothetical protein
MTLKSNAVLSALLLLSSVAVIPMTSTAAQAQGCDVSDRIDHSTADMARAKMEKAGFHRVNDLKKGCDNFWHGLATKDGTAVHVALSPKGDVMAEGN